MLTATRATVVAPRPHHAIRAAFVLVSNCALACNAASTYVGLQQPGAPARRFWAGVTGRSAHHASAHPCTFPFFVITIAKMLARLVRSVAFSLAVARRSPNIRALCVPVRVDASSFCCFLFSARSSECSFCPISAPPLFNESACVLSALRFQSRVVVFLSPAGRSLFSTRVAPLLSSARLRRIDKDITAVWMHLQHVQHFHLFDFIGASNQGIHFS